MQRSYAKPFSMTSSYDGSTHSRTRRIAGQTLLVRENNFHRLSRLIMPLVAETTRVSRRKAMGEKSPTPITFKTPYNRRSANSRVRPS